MLAVGVDADAGVVQGLDHLGVAPQQPGDQDGEQDHHDGQGSDGDGHQNSTPMVSVPLPSQSPTIGR